MEIISFVGSSAAVKKTSVGTNINFPRLPKVSKKKEYRPLVTKSSPSFSSSSVAVKIEKSHSRTERQFAYVGIAKIFSMLACLAVLILVPYTIFNLLSYLDNHTTSLSYDSLSAYEFETLNSAMSRFAMDGTLTDNIDENGNVLSEDGSVLSAASVGLGETVTFQTYTVKAGDSISTISRKFGLSNISTLIAVNDISNVRTLRSGQKLRIPSTDGLVYKVVAGDSLNSLSVKYHVSVEEILDANDLDSDTLTKGMELFIPGAKLDSASLKKAMGELFVYPITAAWRLTSRFGPRKDPFTGVASNHTGIDMACPTGTPIRAAMSGKVVYVGWSNIFGNYVIISHGNGYQSLYGHMSKTLVKKGQGVDQNTRIGLVGSTGYSTGPHLHFTVYKNGNLVDPLSLLKK
ncbi:peptidoglycan DD-metalloendopeptidase family protein [uncultured Treponema sp.]|uniref:peptidoglycan DD-metalloendopeptidase family protein n=1 Tax=uncultured Treponema sp. TaxID=162155 RepID=UPI0025F74F6C|nr:M23 family metallopeptidase [uncultured Treponema sp.]